MGLDSLICSEETQTHKDKLSLLCRHQFILFASMHICSEERGPLVEKGVEEVGDKIR